MAMPKTPMRQAWSKRIVRGMHWSLSGEDLPVNVCQVGHDLDAQLLEFKLMADAREQAANDSHKAEEAEKLSWTQAETKRIEDMAR